MRVRLLAVLALGLSACGGPTPSVMEFVEVSPAQPKIGDVATVRFRLLDSRGLPQAGAKVEFSLQSANNGVTLSPTSAVSLRGSGYAETQIVANTRVNSVIVIATSGDKRLQSPPITFAGTVPSGLQLTFQCGPIGGTGSGGRHAIGAYDQSRHLIAGDPIDCAAHVADRNGDGIEGALVSFLTEAGTIGPSEVSTSNLVGDAVIKYKTSLPLPIETTPTTFDWVVNTDDVHTGEYVAPLWMHPFNWSVDPRGLSPFMPPNFSLQEPRRPDPIRLNPDGSGRRENNPRDNLVSMIAVTSGEEGFIDSDNDGKYTPGEYYDDLTEPFVDSNDDGTWNDNERFIDMNGNGEWDGKNGQWDANTLIWKQERLLWTGIPATEDVIPNVPGVPGHKAVFTPAGCENPAYCTTTPGGNPHIQLTCPGTSAQCHQAGAANDPDRRPVAMYAFITDPWFNSMAKNGDGDTCAVPPDDMAPVKVTGATAAGFAFTYPSNNFIFFTLADKRDPNASPMEQVPRRQPAIGFRATIFCNYTSAPSGGYVVRIGAGTIEGTIE